MTGKRQDEAQKSQLERFVETARALGTDQDEATFKAKLAVIARQKPKGDTEPDKQDQRGRKP